MLFSRALSPLKQSLQFSPILSLGPPFLLCPVNALSLYSRGTGVRLLTGSCFSFSPSCPPPTPGTPPPRALHGRPCVAWDFFNRYSPIFFLFLPFFPLTVRNPISSSSFVWLPSGGVFFPIPLRLNVPWTFFLAGTPLLSPSAQTRVEALLVTIPNSFVR